MHEQPTPSAAGQLADLSEQATQAAAYLRLQPPKRRVLLVLGHTEWPSGTLTRAATFSRVLHAELHVLRILPDGRSIELFLRPWGVSDAVGQAEEMERSRQATKAWLVSVLKDDAETEHVDVQRGALIEIASAHASLLQAELIVVASHGGRFGATVEALARTSALPVLVARAPCLDETIVAATDLLDQSYPVLRAAAALAGRLQMSVIAVHNVDPSSSAVASEPPPWAGSIMFRTDIVRKMMSSRQKRLASIAAGLQCLADSVISSDPSTVAAILREARQRDADLVVVGTRPQAWYQRLNGGGVAAQVVRQARRSVLVTPLPATPQAVHARA